MVTEAGVRQLGAGKVLRKYCTTALRTLEPPPPQATAAALDTRHMHSHNTWYHSYRCHAFAPLQARWAATPADQRQHATVEMLLRMRPSELPEQSASRV